MARFFDDLLASFTIFVSNFTARFGLIFHILLILAVLALLGIAVVRTIMAGATVRRSSPLRAWEPDEALSQHAAENLAKAVQIPTVKDRNTNKNLNHIRSSFRKSSGRRSP